MKPIAFTKMHGIGNDYIYIDCFGGLPADPGRLAQEMSPRHFSVGADGVVLICPSDCADARMRMFNADGSEGKMCGNAIRCVGKYLYDHGICQKKELDIETASGIKHLTLFTESKRVTRVSVDMGYADFTPQNIPVLSDKAAVDLPVEVAGKTYFLTCVSMGNPHAVTFLDGVEELDLPRIGPLFESHPLFPERVNTEFVRVIDRRCVQMRVWERGSGETYACGTGACATVAAGVKKGILDAGVPVCVRLIGGELSIVCTEDFHITMCGGATKVYEGVYEDEDSAE